MSNQISIQSQLSTFNFETRSIRVIAINNEPWFIVKDVCEAAGIANYRDAVERLDDDEKGVALTDTLGGQQEMNIINESGMYTLILRCREAVKKGSVPHRFRKWVTAEVLPQIRKTGEYQKTQLPPSSEYINEQEQRQVQEAVNRAVKRTGRDHNNVYHHLKTKFNVAKYTQLKPEQMRDVLIYLAGMPIKQVPSELETVSLTAQSPVYRLREVLPVAIFYRDVGRMIKELNAICEELSRSRKSELVAILKNYCDTFSGNAALVRKVRGVLITQLGQLPQDDQDYLRDFIEL